MSKQIPLASLVLDFTLYPRHDVDSTRVALLADALRAGITLPPVIADAVTHRVIDGFHRVNANRIVFGEDTKIAADLRTYSDEATMFAAAIAANAAHGLPLSSWDQVRCIERGAELGVTPDGLRTALGISVERFGKIEARLGFKEDGTPIPLKSGVAHLRGRTLSDKQQNGLARISGQRPLFMLNQAVTLLESDLLPEPAAHEIEAVERLVHVATNWLTSVRVPA